MTDREWEKFFELLAKIVNLDGLTANEKYELIREKASECCAEMEYIEFISWHGELF